jgi:hypothetical protein
MAPRGFQSIEADTLSLAHIEGGYPLVAYQCERRPGTPHSYVAVEYVVGHVSGFQHSVRGTVDDATKPLLTKRPIKRFSNVGSIK